MNNEPAFPVNTGSLEGHRTGSSPDTWQFPGMTLRDYFATAAMQSYISHLSCGGTEAFSKYYAEAANESYWIADAMLEARKPRRETHPCRACSGHGLIGGMTIEGGEGWACEDCGGSGEEPS